MSAAALEGGFRTPAAEHAAMSLKRPASETLHKGETFENIDRLPARQQAMLTLSSSAVYCARSIAGRQNEGYLERVERPVRLNAIARSDKLQGTCIVSTPPFDFDLLLTFVAVVDNNSFTRAGERIGRTQSTVSLQIKKLEDT